MSPSLGEGLVGGLPYVLLKKGQTVEDMRQAVAFLVSEDAKNITGQTLNIDGGRHRN